MSLRRASIGVLALIVCTVFTIGATSCGTAKLTCANPKKLTTYHGTLSYPPYVVQQDVWTNVGAQTMYVCGPGNWKAIARQSGAPATGVKTYPDTQKTYTDWQHCSSQPLIGSFTKLTSSFRHLGPNAGSYDYAYDLFFNNSLCNQPLTELMVFTQWRGLSLPAAQLHPVIAGVAWDIYHSQRADGFRYIQVRFHKQRTAGTVNFIPLIHYLEAQHLLRTTDSLQFLAYGPEILTTYGANLPFWLTGFSVSDAHS